jgi:hypothetical protein
MPRFLDTNDVFSWTVEQKIAQWFDAEALQTLRETLELSVSPETAQRMIEFYANVHHEYRIAIHRGTNQAYRTGFKRMIVLLPGMTPEILKAVTAKAHVPPHANIVARVEVEEE